MTASRIQVRPGTWSPVSANPSPVSHRSSDHEPEDHDPVSRPTGRTPESRLGSHPGVLAGVPRPVRRVGDGAAARAGTAYGLALRRVGREERLGRRVGEGRRRGGLLGARAEPVDLVVVVEDRHPGLRGQVGARRRRVVGGRLLGPDGGRHLGLGLARRVGRQVGGEVGHLRVGARLEVGRRHDRHHRGGGDGRGGRRGGEGGRHLGGRPRARDRDVGAGHLADVLEEEVADVARGRVRVVGLALRVEHLVAQGVEHARDAGPDPTRAQHLAVHLGGGRQRRRRDPGPLAGERAVEEAGEVDLVDVDPARGQAAERRLDAEADDPHLPVLVDQHVLGRQAAVRETGVMCLGEAVGDLGHQPGRTSGGERSLAGEQDVEGVALAPLVDDEAAPVGGLGVEDPQQPPVDDGPGAARRLEERLRRGRRPRRGCARPPGGGGRGRGHARTDPPRTRRAGRRGGSARRARHPPASTSAPLTPPSSPVPLLRSL